MNILHRLTSFAGRRRTAASGIACLLAAMTLTPVASAYVLEGSHYPVNQPIVLNLQLGSPGRTLIDGSTTWDQVAQAATGVWNPYLGGGVQFQTNETSLTPAKHDGVNSVFFSSTIFGESFGGDTLGITVTFYNANTQISTESDVVFNNAKRFDSYRGDQRFTGNIPLYDLRRIAIHEFGHVLGLDHTPDGSISIMTPYAGDIDTVQADDIAGVESIYGNPTIVPVIGGNLTRTAAVGSTFTYTIQATPRATSYQAGNLPSGLSLNATTGVISGKPTDEGTFNILLSATNAGGTGTATLVLTVGLAPVITSPLSVSAQIGQPFTYRITASNQPTGFEANLSQGLSIDKTTGLITGIPTTGSNYLFLTAYNAFGSATAAVSVKTVFDNAIVTLHVFNHALTNTEGAEPSSAPLIQGTDGNFYGVTVFGGSANLGTVFRMVPDGTLTTLHSFSGLDGSFPRGALLQAADGNFYGTTTGGDGKSNGTIFKVTPDGTLTTLHSLSPADGTGPQTALLQGRDGNFYGATSGRGAASNSGGIEDPFGTGTIFKMTPDGILTVLHLFTGSERRINGLIQAADGNFYGLALGGGFGLSGVVFRMTPDGTLTTLHTFESNVTGINQAAALVQGSDGNFYGAMNLYGGGPGGSNGSAFFKMTPDGSLTNIHTLSLADGYNPSTLILGRNGNFYGTTAGGGSVGTVNANGKLLELTPDGTVNTLHAFETSGSNFSVLVQGSDGEFYGATNPTPGDGTIYRTTLLSPVVAAPSLPVVTLEVTTPAVTLGSGGQAVFTVRLSEAQPVNTMVYYTVKAVP